MPFSVLHRGATRLGSSGAGAAGQQGAGCQLHMQAFRVTYFRFGSHSVLVQLSSQAVLLKLCSVLVRGDLLLSMAGGWAGGSGFRMQGCGLSRWGLAVSRSVAQFPKLRQGDVIAAQ